MLREPKTEIRWLHLSDFHLRKSQGWSQDVVLNSLLEDIRSRYSDQNKPDLLFISGDIAFSGKVEEYLLGEEFIQKLQEATSLSPDRLFIVPGNHDIDRTIEEDAFLGAITRMTNAIEVDKFFANEARCKTLFKRQGAFRDFVNRLAPPNHGGYKPTGFAHSKSTTVGPINVRVLLLDSAWVGEGGPSDKGSLLVGERQVLDAYGTPETSALTFGLVHHPFAWLCEFERVPIENLLIDRVNVLLIGHVHSVDMRSIDMLERRLTVFTAGAAFETRTSNNSYGWGSVDLLTGKGKSVIHKYMQTTKRWQALEPQGWRLLQKSNPSVRFEEAVGVFSQAGGNFVYYGAALLASYSAEVPCYIDGKLVYLDFEAEMPEQQNPIGQIVTNLRHLFYWKQVWEPEKWASELTRLIEQFNISIKGLENESTDIATFLAQQEHRCRQTAEAIMGPVLYKTSTVIAHLESLRASGDWGTALTIIDRWCLENVLNEEEEKEIRRIEVQALLELNRISDATEKIMLVLGEKSARGSDFHLAAVCYYTAKSYKAAAQYMHKAIDHNIDINAVRKLALLIAGQAGDPTLTDRVMQDE